MRDVAAKWRDAKQAALRSPGTRAALSGLGKAQNAVLKLPGAKRTVSKWRQFTEAYSGMSCLGIHYTPTDMTAILLEKGESGLERTDSVTIAIEPAIQDPEISDDTQGSDDPVLRALQKLYERMRPQAGRAHPVALSLGADFYQTQFHHSDFEQAKQIKQTLRFDIEDEFMVDAENVFLCFQQLPTLAEGCDLMVHTADRDQLTLIAEQFEQAGLDALVAEPDIVSWLHYLENQQELTADHGLIVAGRCTESIHLLILSRDKEPVLTRTFFCPDAANSEELLVGEMPRCLALLEEPPQHLFYHGLGFNRMEMKCLGNTLSLDVQELPQQDIREAFAEGVACGLLAAEVETDFRTDGLVPRTMEKSRHKALLGLSVAVSLFLLVAIFAMKNKTGYYQDVSSLAKDHVGEVWEKIPHRARGERSISKIRSNLEKMARSYGRKNSDSASSDLPDSINGTFRLFLASLQPLPDNFDVVIDSLRLRSDSVDLSGTVANLDGFQKLQAAVESQPELKVEKWDYNPSGDKRCEYNMAVSAENIRLKKERGRRKGGRHASKSR